MSISTGINSLPLVSIIFTSFNRRDDVVESLEKLSKQEYPDLEIVIVDNCSSDGTQEIIEKKFSSVKLIKMPNSKYGACETANIAFANAKGKYIIILDDDSYPEKDAVKKVVEEFERDPEVGAIAFRILQKASTGNLIQDTWGFVDLNHIFKPEIDKDKENDSLKLISFVGNGAAFRSDLIKKINYFPSLFFMYANEIDTSFRIWNEGFKLKYCPHIISYHKWSPVNRPSRKSIYYGRRNVLLLASKYLTNLYKTKVYLFIITCLFLKTIFLKDIKENLLIIKDFFKLKGQYKKDYVINYKQKISFTKKFKPFFEWYLREMIFENPISKKFLRIINK